MWRTKSPGYHCCCCCYRTHDSIIIQTEAAVERVVAMLAYYSVLQQQLQKRFLSCSKTYMKKEINATIAPARPKSWQNNCTSLHYTFSATRTGTRLSTQKRRATTLRASSRHDTIFPTHTPPFVAAISTSKKREVVATHFFVPWH